MTDRTPLEKIQDEARKVLLPSLTASEARELGRFIIQAFDAGVRAAQELAATAVPAEAEKPSRPSATRSVWTVH